MVGTVLYSSSLQVIMFVGLINVQWQLFDYAASHNGGVIFQRFFIYNADRDNAESDMLKDSSLITVHFKSPCC
jgi:hypothetical protein